MNRKTNSSFKKWLIIGPTPPPIGGVTIFIERFIAKLKRKNIDAINFYPNSHHSLLRLFSILIYFPDIVMVNSMRWQLLFLGLILFPFSIHIVVDHNHSRKLIGRKKTIETLIVRFLLNRYDRIWIVSPHLTQNYSKLKLKTRITLRSPYLKPDVSKYKTIISNFSLDLQKILHKCKQQNSNKVIYAISAYHLTTEKGLDLYGFDLAINALYSLIKSGSDALLIIFVANPERTKTYENAKNLIEKFALTEHVIWEEGQKPLWPIFLNIDAYLRPTVTDGWSVSVSEALSFGCPVIASDIVPRHKDCILFSRDTEGDLVSKMLSVRKRKFN